jgi:tRNA threonylcarbamoyladenosine biosynthesis protein TsaB
MLVLGIDTAGRRAGAALMEDDVVLVARSSVGPHSAVLLPMISEILAGRALAPAAIDLVGVACGPGTYTGLRVGVVTAKALGRATGATVLGIPTLDAMASLAPESARRVLVVLHAYKRRVLCGWYARDGSGRLEIDVTPELLDAGEVPRAVQGEAVITDAATLIADLGTWGAEVRSFDDAATSVARLAASRLAGGAGDEAYTLVPDYLKPPPVTISGGGGAPAS